MRVLVLGQGGREHAISWKLSQSPLVKEIITLPGNPGTAAIPKNINHPKLNVQEIFQYAQKEKFDLTVVGPEQPLAEGIVDLFEKAGLPIFGPTQAAAQLESSKTFAKKMMDECGIPTAQYKTFNQFTDIERFLNSQAKFPLVLKADGLAAGKGVKICTNLLEALTFAKECLADGKFSTSGHIIVAEEFLEGFEVSFLVFASGTSFQRMEIAQDHKKLLDGNQGPNTGGMGALCPIHALSHEDIRHIETTIIQPMLNAMSKRGTPFFGILYAGLMMTQKGPYVLEFNTRFGDPETQVILPKLQSDLFSVCLGIAQKKPVPDLTWDPRYAVGVVLAAEGYPETSSPNYPILNIPKTDGVNAHIFHSGTAIKNETLVVAGGRVMTVCALDHSIALAREHAYALAQTISFPGKFFRKDIGLAHGQD